MRDNEKNAWFIAFAPLENPTIALAVMVENGGGGSEFAAPVARKVLDYHLRDYQPVAEVDAKTGVEKQPRVIAGVSEGRP